MEVKSINEQLFFTTVRIETDKGIGTGFFVNYNWGKDKKGQFLVTNKHVIKNTSKEKFFFIKSDGNKPILGQRYDIEVNDFEEKWFGHPNQQIDVAVMPVIILPKNWTEGKGGC